jgi:hypothetical protein
MNRWHRLGRVDADLFAFGWIVSRRGGVRNNHIARLDGRQSEVEAPNHPEGECPPDHLGGNEGRCRGGGDAGESCKNIRALRILPKHRRHCPSVAERPNFDRSSAGASPTDSGFTVQCYGRAAY